MPLQKFLKSSLKIPRVDFSVVHRHLFNVHEKRLKQQIPRSSPRHWLSRSVKRVLSVAGMLVMLLFQAPTCAEELEFQATDYSSDIATAFQQYREQHYSNVKLILDQVKSFRELKAEELEIYIASLIKLRYFPDAARVLETALARSPNDPRALYNYGLVLKEQNNLMKAEECFRRAATFSAGPVVSAKAYIALSQLYLAANDLDSSFLFSAKAVALEPANEEYRFYFGTLAIRVQQLEAAAYEVTILSSMASPKADLLRQKLQTVLDASGMLVE